MRYAVLFADPVSKRDSIIYLILDKLMRVLTLMSEQVGKIAGGLGRDKTTK
jgi:hypothetical protein